MPACVYPPKWLGFRPLVIFPVYSRLIYFNAYSKCFVSLSNVSWRVLSVVNKEMSAHRTSYVCCCLSSYRYDGISLTRLFTHWDNWQTWAVAICPSGIHGRRLHSHPVIYSVPEKAHRINWWQDWSSADIATTILRRPASTKLETWEKLENGTKSVALLSGFFWLLQNSSNHYSNAILTKTRPKPFFIPFQT